MKSCCPENLPYNQRKAIDELIRDKLIRGREFANQLKVIFSDSIGDGSARAEDLVVKVVNTFTSTLSILNGVESNEVSQFPASIHVGSPCYDGRKSEDSGESVRSTSKMRDRRECCKKRKASHSWIRDSPDLQDDGHAWRKYGQKVILNAKFPRNYFRCTHKFDQGCQATKQVQRIEEEPSMYRTTYSGHHTCKNLLRASQLMLDVPGVTDSSILLSFNDNGHGHHHDNITNICVSPFLSSFQSIKHHVSHNQSYSSDHYLLSPDDHLFKLDPADVICGVHSSCTNNSSITHQSSDVDMIVTSVDSHLDDVLAYFDS